RTASEAYLESLHDQPAQTDADAWADTEIARLEQTDPKAWIAHKTIVLALQNRVLALQQDVGLLVAVTGDAAAVVQQKNTEARETMCSKTEDNSAKYRTAARQAMAAHKNRQERRALFDRLCKLSKLPLLGDSQRAAYMRAVRQE
ncbi:MAG: hypothetical protein RLZ51_2389, partial [Pseudomonadota bacterium]